jgi:uncharacterized protein YbaR (Trm112 family)
MKKNLLDLLICPSCLPGEQRFRETVVEADGDDITTGQLTCGRCGIAYPIREGIAFLDPERKEEMDSVNRYETPAVLSSYLWSHYGDLLRDPEASDAYIRWADLMAAHPGPCLDSGSAVGRFSFEMARKCDFVVGVDNSVSFIRLSRDLMKQRGTAFALAVEGDLKKNAAIVFPDDWRTDNVEFIVGNVLALPFRAGLFSSVSSLNIVDKVPSPLTHLMEINRAAKRKNAQLLFSDPFSWSSDAVPRENWLGGSENGGFPGRAADNVAKLLNGRENGFKPAWRIEDHGHVWWKIRTHENHFELIRSVFIKAVR